MRASRWAADGVAALSVLLLVPAEILAYIANPGALIGNLLVGGAFVLGFGGVGWLLWRRVPHNPIGWSFSISALASAVAFLGHGWATQALAGHIAPDTLTRAAAVVDTYGWILAIPLAVPAPLLLLPDGRLPSRRWRPVLWAVLGGCAAGTVGLLTQPGEIGQFPYEHVVNPIGLTAFGAAPYALAATGLITMLTGTLAGIVAVVRRFRRSRALERQQLRWVALGGVCALVGIGFGTRSQDPGLTGVIGGLGSAIGVAALPASIAVAVLRYRLYDLGRLVSRTVSYAAITGTLLAVYIGLVTAVSTFQGRDNPLVVAASTLIVAALFQPLRRRVQSAVDRRFNRARYDAGRTVEAFSTRLRDEVDLESLRADLITVVRETMAPSTVGVWLRSGEVRR